MRARRGVLTGRARAQGTEQGIRGRTGCCWGSVEEWVVCGVMARGRKATGALHELKVSGPNLVKSPAWRIPPLSPSFERRRDDNDD